jgi:hypothetical protein
LALLLSCLLLEINRYCVPKDSSNLGGKVAIPRIVRRFPFENAYVGSRM